MICLNLPLFTSVYLDLTQFTLIYFNSPFVWAALVCLILGRWVVPGLASGTSIVLSLNTQLQSQAQQMPKEKTINYMPSCAGFIGK